MKSYLSKMRGGGKAPARPRISYVIWSWFGGFVGIAATAYLTHVTGNSFETGTSFLIAPFGATCVIAFGLPDSPVAQPRNIVGGHFISTLIGLIFLWLGEPVWWGHGACGGNGDRCHADNQYDASTCGCRAISRYPGRCLLGFYFCTSACRLGNPSIMCPSI